jgi:hypothetical protein
MALARLWRCLLVAAIIAPAALGAPAGAGADPREEPSEAVPVAGPGRSDYFGVAWLNPPNRPAGPARIDQARWLGATWDRFPFYWSRIQSQPDAPYDWSSVEAVVRSNETNGFRSQAIFLGAPRWAVQDGRPDVEAWTGFVTAAVSRYRGRIQYWEIWNEPDLLRADGRGFFWPWSLEVYVDLLRASYRAIKAEAPEATVLLGGLAVPHNNKDWFARLLGILADDPEAREANDYFDVLPLHLYSRSSGAFDLPLGYAGGSELAGFRSLMRARGAEKPIWINEAGVAVWEGGGVPGPGRATADEQASFVLQAFAYGRAAGVRRFFAFQLYDDGAGRLDPSTGRPMEFFGLVDNRGDPRPAYFTSQTAVRYLAQARVVTRANEGRDAAGARGIERITFYGTPAGKATVLWNNDGGAPRPVWVRASAARAVLVDKHGRETAIAAAEGGFALTLPPATNNQSLSCLEPTGCDADDYIIGGSPYILVEPDGFVPAAVVAPLPSAVRAPFAVSWQAVDARAARYDVQYQDPADGRWRDWLRDAAITSALFGRARDGVEANRTYAFRVRARDAGGGLLTDYTPQAMASTTVVGVLPARGAAAGSVP